MFFGTNQRTAEKRGAIYTERIQFPKDGSPGSRGNGGEKERKQKRSTLFLKATAEQHAREPGRQRQAKEDTSHVCPPTQGAEMEPSINYHQKWPTLTLGAPVQALGHRKSWNKLCHINMGTGEACHSLKQNCVIKAH